MSELNPLLLLKGARSAAWRYTPAWLQDWREDIAQDVVEYALRLRERSPVVGQFVFQRGTWRAIRRLGFLLRHQAELAEDFDAPVDGPSELGPIALWRLQEVWDDLTDIQRLAVGQLLSGESPVALARASGFSQTSLFRARQTALARIDNPAAFSRGREYQRVNMSTPRHPADSAKVAACQARDAEYARRKRAAKKVLIADAASSGRTSEAGA